MGALGFELFTHERIAVATPQCACHRGSGRRRAPFARALGASVDCCGPARLCPVRIGRRSGGTNRASADVRPSPWCRSWRWRLRTCAISLPGRFRPFAAANPPSEFQRSFGAPGRSVTRR